MTTRQGVGEALLFILLPSGAFATVLWALFTHDLPWQFTWTWVAALDIDLAFRVDGLSALMLLMVTGVGAAVFIYTAGYLTEHSDRSRAYQLLTLFMVAMIGSVTADHLLVLFMFWEGTSLLSFMLVGFYHERLESRKAAQQSLLVTGSGGLVLLAGFILLGENIGSYQISTIVATLPDAPETPELQLAMLLILAGAFTKSAQVPFHFWLPNAMSAPTPASAYLHSATMVKLGVYLLARLDPGFGDWLLWTWLLKGVGSATAAWGMVLALRERDLKRILAWSTVATLGTLVVLVGLRSANASVAVGLLLLAHALYKAPLFFVAGIIDHGAGTRLLDRLGGLRRQMPWTAVAALLAAASMAGLPLSLGFVAKDMILDAKSGEDVFLFARAANTVFGIIAVAVAGIAAVRLFWLPAPPGVTCRAHEGSVALVLPPLALALAGIALGVFPFMAQDLIAAAASAMHPAVTELPLNLSLNLQTAWGALGTSLLLGTLVYLLWDRLHAVTEWLAGRIGKIGMTSIYDHSLDWIPLVAAATTRRLQQGHLPVYVAMLLGSAAITVGAALWFGRADAVWPAPDTPSLGVAGACCLIMLGAVAVTLMHDRLVLLLANGLIGYGSAVLFLFLGSPDLAYTQFTVETVFVIVVAAVLLKLKRLGLGNAVAEPRWRPAAALLAAALASVLTLLIVLVYGVAFDPQLSEYFGNHSLDAAHGRNVVNVILVDFRAIDTLGEVSVVMLSLLAAWPLLYALRRTQHAGREQMQVKQHIVILSVVAKPLYWLILLVSLWVLLRGHNEPGGGFIGGLIAVSATVLWAAAHNTAAARRRLPLGDPIRLAALGVLLMLLSGLPGWLGGQAYLTHLWLPASLNLPLSTVTLFDTGVYLGVWGALAGEHMIWGVAAAIWIVLAAGFYLCLSRDVFRITLGLAVLSSAVNLLLLATGRLDSALPAVIPQGELVLAGASNPLPQALVLTAIVIGFALTCFSLVLVLGLIRRTGGDDIVALREAEPPSEAKIKPPLPQPRHEPPWPPEQRS
ncbi:unnamed protein product [Cyprideis torosa]|uniref:NADH-ubiquinone oxidoreductase chain 4L n=1 Tax=Cyprideis torosa TaxID=163714 RepID=A0A7R8WP37_9CRUS|nr:unnamed protein product [Cyprideis torosa]CAG0904705.1 unnamed protein product [Cyprideis torosa]